MRLYVSEIQLFANICTPSGFRVKKGKCTSYLLSILVENYVTFFTVILFVI